ncbi:MAG: TerB family tellurite resistance protein [Candidatus Cloacimonetes bacterium]|nr:TerB family tellurite resistance protein [Candidatus Cloacimonadota bacterium]
MNNLKSAFTILYLLASCDGEVSSSELELIMKFFQDNQEKIEFNHHHLISTLLFLSEEENKLRLAKAAQEYKNDSSEAERLDLLRFAFNLVISDGKIATEEIRMFNILGNSWDIDIDEFIKSNHHY